MCISPTKGHAYITSLLKTDFIRVLPVAESQAHQQAALLRSKRCASRPSREKGIGNWLWGGKRLFFPVLLPPPLLYVGGWLQTDLTTTSILAAAYTKLQRCTDAQTTIEEGTSAMSPSDQLRISDDVLVNMTSLTLLPDRAQKELWQRHWSHNRCALCQLLGEYMEWAAS